MKSSKVYEKYIALLVLILSGECIFLLPFVITRVFRPSFLKAFGISNFELGTAFSVYGIIAMLAYLLGGPFADRFSSKKLISLSLLLTGLLGMFMASIPSTKALTFLYGLFGLSTILFFWSAFTKTTRAVGGNFNQGKSFGIVDAGRGLLTAILASSAALLFDALLPSNSMVEKDALKSALSNVILLFSFITIACSILVWVFIPHNLSSQSEPNNRFSVNSIGPLLKRKSIWWNAIIVLCSYIGYKCTDDFSLYAVDVYGYTDVEAAHISTVSFWIRPLAAVFAGFLADRFTASKMIAYCFVIMSIGSFLLGGNFLLPSLGSFFILNIIISSIGIYGLRGLYFTLFHEAKLPLKTTGTAVGIVSIIGFTPDIFMGPLMGYLTDNYSDGKGHQYLFLFLSIISLIGLFANHKFTRSK